MSHRFSRGRTLSVLFGLALISGCGGSSERFMIPIPPPRAWEAELLESRAAKDEFFRASPESPWSREENGPFEGLSYWPPDPGFYFVGPIRFLERPERFTIVSTAGEPRPCEKIGWVEFRRDGRDLALQVYRLLDAEPQPGTAGLFLPFMDATTGTETYPAGRYLDLEGPPGGPYALDFNQAYNPYCAYGSPERFACPRTPPENRLPIRVTAGERGFASTGRTRDSE